MENTKIAILRGINVGGKRKILMQDLRHVAECLGWQQVKTYIQSGNLLFNSAKPTEELAQDLKEAISGSFGFDVPIIVITAQELKKAIELNPFADPSNDISQLHLTFLATQPSQEGVESLEQVDSDQDQFSVIGSNVFIKCIGKYHKSKLSNTTIEKKLGITATTRNWKTVLKLAEIVEEY